MIAPVERQNAPGPSEGGPGGPDPTKLRTAAFDASQAALDVLRLAWSETERGSTAEHILAEALHHAYRVPDLIARTLDAPEA